LINIIKEMLTSAPTLIKDVKK